jgi:hypothetical protein
MDDFCWNIIIVTAIEETEEYHFLFAELSIRRQSVTCKRDHISTEIEMP